MVQIFVLVDEFEKEITVPYDNLLHLLHKKLFHGPPFVDFEVCIARGADFTNV